MATGTFATAIDCIDGRAQGPVSDWVKIHAGATFVDTVTIPGPDKALTQGAAERIAAVREYVEVSVRAHASQFIAVAGHHECAANPVSADEHKAMIRAAVEGVRGWGLPVRVVGLYVNEWWQIEVVE